MKTTRIPQTDSISALAAFWDTHDLTDFEDDLEEVTTPVFEHVDEHEATISIHLDRQDFIALQQLAHEQGVEQATLVQAWVREKLRAA